MKAMTKNVTPRNTATPVIRWIKWWISLAIGVSPVSRPDASPAIRPITVWSPQLITTPLAVPVNKHRMLPTLLLSGKLFSYRNQVYSVLSTWLSPKLLLKNTKYNSHDIYLDCFYSLILWLFHMPSSSELHLFIFWSQYYSLHPTAVFIFLLHASW